MRLSKFLLAILAVTFFAVLYVYQQTEIFRLAYSGQKSFGAFQDLLDKNTLLRYNIERSASLVRIGNKITKDADFQMPDNYRLMKVVYLQEGLKPAKQLPVKKENIFSRIFGIKQQAEAKTINPSIQSGIDGR